VTGTDAVAAQARQLAEAWSPPDSPPSWSLTAALFATLRDDAELLAVAAEIDPSRLPALLFVAAAVFLVSERAPEPLAAAFPTPGEPQPALPSDFPDAFRRFCLAHRDELLDLAARHRYQMSEPARCAHLLPALAEVAADAARPLYLVDLGTGAGFALRLDRYRYVFRRGESAVTVGDPAAGVVLETELRGARIPPLPAQPPQIAGRVGVDTEPLDLGAPAVRRWLRACVPPVADAVTRFERAADLAVAHPAETIRGDAIEVVEEVAARAPDHAHLCFVDAYVHVFFTPEQRERFAAAIAAVGESRDLDWISLDPLVPLGPDPRTDVLGTSVPESVLERARRAGVVGVLARLAVRRGLSRRSLHALGHPGGAWLEWLD
jgi:hypothetical protein